MDCPLNPEKKQRVEVNVDTDSKELFNCLLSYSYGHSYECMILWPVWMDFTKWICSRSILHYIFSFNWPMLSDLWE